MALQKRTLEQVKRGRSSFVVPLEASLDELTQIGVLAEDGTAFFEGLSVIKLCFELLARVVKRRHP